MVHRLLRPSACVLGLAAGLGLAGCGGSSRPATNGTDGKAPDAIVAAAKQAADTAGSVHVAGSIAGTGGATTFDLNLVRGRGGRGTLAVNGLSFDLIRVGSAIYVKGSPAFYRRFSGTAAQVLQGKWLKGSATSGTFKSIGPFTDLPTFVDKALARQPTMKLTKGPTATTAGQRVVQVKDSSGGTLSVALSGRPYPVQIAKGGTAGGTIGFDRWNVPVRLSAPAGSFDISRLPAGK